MTEKTSDYSIFKKLPGNTPIDALNLKKIVSSIKINNMLDLRPIIVNKGMEVVDGQHRLEAAKLLGVPIFYIIQEDAKATDVVLLNTAQRQWGTHNYVEFYAAQGNPVYKDISAFCARHNMKINSFIALAGMSGGQILKKIKAGKLEMNLSEKKDEIERKIFILEQTKQILGEKLTGDKKFLNSSFLKRALSFLLGLGNFDHDTFITKLKMNIEKVHVCHSVIAYVEMFKGIYNTRNQNPI